MYFMNDNMSYIIVYVYVYMFLRMYVHVFTFSLDMLIYFGSNFANVLSQDMLILLGSKLFSRGFWIFLGL